VGCQEEEGSGIYQKAAGLVKLAKQTRKRGPPPEFTQVYKRKKFWLKARTEPDIGQSKLNMINLFATHIKIIFHPIQIAVCCL